MTLQQMEERLLKLEDEFRKLETRVAATSEAKPWRATFGMFAEDAEFDEVLRLGREYRDQQKQSP